MIARTVLVLSSCLLAVAISATSTAAEPAIDPVALGRQLFFDTNLSLRRTQSCATCHDPSRAFTDPRDNGVGGAASLGDDGKTLADRNAPTLTYIGLTPPFRLLEDGEYSGGFFLDGRARELAAQAAGPLLNPKEMALPDAAVLVARLREAPHYRALGTEVLADPTRAMAAVGAALAAFQRSSFFASFDSRYDRYLRGEYELTEEEEIGRRLFFSPLTNCASCHVLNSLGTGDPEPFTNYRYHNIATPRNDRLRAVNGRSMNYIDRGLAQNPTVQTRSAAGKFKVPTLRNIAVTAPYMHNGVFRELSTAIHFYNRHLVTNASSRTNPETGQPWAAPEVADNIAGEFLAQGQPLTAERIDTLIAFLSTLTDRRYESLLVPPASPP